ncbi:hypothetical protein L2E82_39627 [Cichorium intybus]|uniref:Uncharacterized protein n=1 Tax=Cichorium intybus TaxID=13427 RepID=A0ACB9AI12_CICIN|nr:hypothetical protein L2E82_39627 [Cichorium intybus]
MHNVLKLRLCTTKQCTLLFPEHASVIPNLLHLRRLFYTGTATSQQDLEFSCASPQRRKPLTTIVVSKSMHPPLISTATKTFTIGHRLRLRTTNNIHSSHSLYLGLDVGATED